jgi:hypothetical protein
MGNAGDRRGVVELGHNLGALLKGKGIVFVLAVRGLEDESGRKDDASKENDGGWLHALNESPSERNSRVRFWQASAARLQCIVGISEIRSGAL